MRVHRPDQVSEPLRRGGVARPHARLFRNALQLCHHARFQIRVFREAAASEAQPHHRMAFRPVVAAVDVQPREQRLVALEQLLQRVQEQALAEPPRPRQEVVRALAEQPLDVGRLVHVVTVLLPNLAEGLDADRQPASGHPGRLQRIEAAAAPGHVFTLRTTRMVRTTRMAEDQTPATPGSAAPVDPTESAAHAAHRRPPGGTRCARIAPGTAHRTLP